MPGLRNISPWRSVALYTVLIIIGTHLPYMQGGPPPPVNADKIIHFIGYAPLGALVFRAGKISGYRPLAITLLGMVAVVLFASLDEYTQGFVPGRNPSVLDALADITGFAIGLFVMAMKYTLRGSKTADNSDTEIHNAP